MIKWKEQDLFKWLSDNYYKTLVNSRNPISRWDCYDIDTRNRIELKCRRKHYDTLILYKRQYIYLKMILIIYNNIYKSFYLCIKHK